MTNGAPLRRIFEQSEGYAINKIFADDIYASIPQEQWDEIFQIVESSYLLSKTDEPNGEIPFDRRNICWRIYRVEKDASATYETDSPSLPLELLELHIWLSPIEISDPEYTLCT